MKVGELALIEMPIIQSIEGLRTCYFQLEYKKSDMRARLPMHDMSSNSIIVLSA
jgi:RNA polymerase-interacting CarD/CdnL/TRCF family regulator